jgi:dTDP-4-dehydrorhamnose reductase
MSVEPKPRLVIVGASGQIGTALHRAAARDGRRVAGTANTRSGGELVAYDMRRDPLRAAVPDLGPADVVYLLAGYISPGWIFEHPDEARTLNLARSRAVAEEVAACGARLVFLSTDQVFDGKAGGYRETTSPSPLNLYGRLKAEMERHTLALGGYVARTGWNVGWSDGGHCVVAQTYEALLRPNARMAWDNVINVTDIDDTARGLLALGEARPPPSRIYHFASAPGVARTQLADTVARASRFGDLMRYARVDFASLPYSEPRPTRAWLDNALAQSELGLVFRAPEDVISAKVALLDQWHPVPNAAVGGMEAR